MKTLVILVNFSQMGTVTLRMTMMLLREVSSSMRFTLVGLLKRLVPFTMETLSQR